MTSSCVSLVHCTHFETRLVSGLPIHSFVLLADYDSVLENSTLDRELEESEQFRFLHHGLHLVVRLTNLKGFVGLILDMDWNE